MELLNQTFTIMVVGMSLVFFFLFWTVGGCPAMSRVDPLDPHSLVCVIA